MGTHWFFSDLIHPQESNPEYTFHDFEELTALSDNYDSDLEQTINSGELLPAGVHECEVRAGAIVACEKIIAASDGKVNVGDLDGYLWRVGMYFDVRDKMAKLVAALTLGAHFCDSFAFSIGKEPRFRGLERHATRDTFFY
ncbi:Cobyrinic acid a,c-diamide synthase, partial [Globisporangium splendens]